MINGRELFAEISNEAISEDGEAVGYFIKNSRMELLERLLSAPPAPAVVNGRTAEGWMAEALLQKSVADDLRKSLPGVPEEMTPEMMRAVQLHSELGAYAAANLTGAYGMFAEFWKVACRAAMLDNEK